MLLVDPDLWWLQGAGGLGVELVQEQKSRLAISALPMLL